MESIPIILTNVGVFKDGHLDLPHEAAHLWHLKLDQYFQFSKLWLDNFPKLRGPSQSWSDPELVTANGTASEYGNFMYLDRDQADPTIKSLTEPIGELSVLEEDGLKLECFGHLYIPIEVIHKTLVRDRNCLTPEMAEAVDHIQYFPAGSGSYMTGGRDREYFLVAEDIATMTESLYAASLFPRSMIQFIRRLQQEPILKQKAEALVQERFVKSSSLEYLLNPNILRGAQVYDYSPEALSARVSPPFIGYVPTHLADHELSYVDWQSLSDIFLEPEMVSPVKHPAGIFYGVQTPDKHSVDELLAFVLSRSDLGILYACTTASLTRTENKYLWFSGPNISSPEEAVKVNKKIIDEFGLQVQL